MKKKIFAVFMALAMVMCFMPSFVSGEGAQNVCKIGNTEYPSIDAALAASHEGEDSDNPTVITLIADFTEHIWIKSGRYITLDLNDHVLKGNSGSVLAITNNGLLTIRDTALNKTKKYFDIDEESGLWKLKESGTSDHYITGGVVTGWIRTDGDGAEIENGEGATMIITGGSFVGNSASNGAIRNFGTLKMTGGTVTGNVSSFIGCVFNTSDMSVGGDVVIYGNKGEGLADNLITTEHITIGTNDEAPTSDMKIGISILTIGEDEELITTTGQFTANGTNSSCSSRFISDNKAYSVAYNENDGGYLELVEGVDKCTYTRALSAANEARTLVLGGKEAGSYTVYGSSLKGYKLMKDGKYLTFENGKLNENGSSSFNWKYDGGLYAETKTVIKSRILFRCFSQTKVTRQYLSFDGEKLVLSSSKVGAGLQVTSDKHTYRYIHNGDGCHEAVCVNCGRHENAEKHEYDETTHLCKCGKLNPDLCCVNDVNVCEKKTVSYCGSWFWKRSVCYYQYNIIPEAWNVGISKVEYSASGDEGSFKTGSVINSSVRLSEFYIRVTDSNGKVTNWKYEKGDVNAVKQELPLTVRCDDNSTNTVNITLEGKDGTYYYNLCRAQSGIFNIDDSYNTGTVVVSGGSGTITGLEIEGCNSTLFVFKDSNYTEQASNYLFLSYVL